MKKMKNYNQNVNQRTVCRWWVAGVIGLMTSVTLSGQTVYTLEQCRQQALEHNVKMKRAQNEVLGAEETRKEAFTRYFPTVSAAGMGFDANRNTMSLSMGQGMEMSMLKNGLAGGVTAMQPVFAGGRIVQGNKLAKLSVEVQQCQVKLSENEVLLNVESYFWQLTALKEKRRTLQTVQTMLEQLYHDVEVAVEAGTTTRNDLLRVKLKRNGIAGDILNLDNAISLSKLVLAQYIGQEGREIDCRSEIPVEQLPAPPADLYQDHRAALGRTAEYRLLTKNVESEVLQKKLLVGEQLPSVGVGVGYVHQNLMNKPVNFGLVMASVSIPLSGWWGASHAIKKQQLKVENARDEQTDRGDLLVIRMQKVWNDLKNAYEQLGIAQNSIEQATENLRLNTEYYRAGVTKMSDLLDAQSLFQQSRDTYVDNYGTYQLKRVEYEQAVGL